jgi:hypothetical protein
LLCHAREGATGVVSNVAGSAFERMCQAFADAGATVLKEVADAFLASSTVDLDRSGIDGVFAVTASIGAMVALLLLLGQVLRTGLTFRGEHLAQGVVGVFKAGLAIGCVTAAAALLLSVADDLSELIMDETVGGRDAFTERLGHSVSFSSAGGNPAAPAALMLIFGLVAILVGIVLFAEMIFRHALIVVLVAVSPIAAAGMVAGHSAPWWRRLVTAGVQLIFLKPLIVLIFGVSFAVAGSATGVVGVLAGLTTLAFAAFAWPMLAKSCTWTAGQVGAAGGAGALIGGLAGAGSVALLARGGAGAGAGSMLDSDRATMARHHLTMNAVTGGAGLARMGGASGAVMGPAAMTGGVGALAMAGSAATGQVRAGMDRMISHAGLDSGVPPPATTRDLGPIPPGPLPPPRQPGPSAAGA